MKTFELARAIARWVGAHAQTESRFLTPYPESTVGAHDLLDFIHEKTGVPKEQLGAWVDEGIAKRDHDPEEEST